MKSISSGIDLIFGYLMCSHNCTIITACILSNDDTCTVRFPRFISVLLIINWLQYQCSSGWRKKNCGIYTHAIDPTARQSAGQISVSATASQTHRRILMHRTRRAQIRVNPADIRLVWHDRATRHTSSCYRAASADGSAVHTGPGPG